MNVWGPDKLQEDQVIIESFVYEEPDLFEMHNAFVESRFYARCQEMPPRFAQKHDPGHAFSREEFLYILGIDVEHVTHPIKQWHLGKLLLKDTTDLYVSRSEKERQAVTAVLHDFGEAATVAGDIAYADKTDEDEREEMRALRSVLSELYGNEQGAELFVYIEPALDPATEPGRIFKLAERVGYAATQLRAWQYQQEFGDYIPDDQIIVCQSIACEFSFHHPHLEQGRGDYPYIDDFLLQNAANLAEMGKLPGVEEVQRGVTLLQYDT